MTIRYFFLLCLLFISFSISIAQNTIILQILIPEAYDGINTQDALAEFEANHPGVLIQINTDNRTLPVPTDPLSSSNYFDTLREKAQSADVIFVESDWFGTAGFQTGYFLDMQPLIRVDTSFDGDNYMSPALVNFASQSGQQALPATFSPTALLFNETAFDNAGLSYPDEALNTENLRLIVDTLATQSNGEAVITLERSSLPLFAHLLTYGRNIDILTTTALEYLEDSRLHETLTTLLELEQAGLLQLSFTLNAGDSAPLQMGSALLPEQFENYSIIWQGVDSDGFAMSAGTDYPDLAYELIKFMTTDLGIVSQIGAFPAHRIALETIQQERLDGIDATAIEQSAFPALRVPYSEYVITVWNQMRVDNIPADIAMPEQIAAAEGMIETAIGQQSEPILINAPDPALQLADGEIALNFGIYTSRSPLPTQTVWEDMAFEFSTDDSEVGLVVIHSEYGPQADLEQFSRNFDCFYTPFNMVSLASTEHIRDLTPLITTDASLNLEDFHGNVLDQVTRNNQILGFPLTIKPLAMRVNMATLTSNGLSIPVTWSVADFNAVLEVFRAEINDESIIFPERFSGGEYLLALIAAYDGLPIDYRTEPPIINFTDDETLNAIRFILDLAREGIIDYETVGSYSPPDSSPLTPPVIIEDVSGEGSFSYIGMNPGLETDYRTLPFPSGNRYTALSYESGIGYIGADTPHIQACYRFLRHVSQNTYLFSAIPARETTLATMSNNPTISQDVFNFYQVYAEHMNNASTVLIPNIGRVVIADLYRRTWLYNAFDAYVLENADLETVLQIAEEKTQLFENCLQTILLEDNRMTVEAMRSCQDDAENA